MFRNTKDYLVYSCWIILFQAYNTSQRDTWKPPVADQTFATIFLQKFSSKKRDIESVTSCLGKTVRENLTDQTLNGKCDPCFGGIV